MKRNLSAIMCALITFSTVSCGGSAVDLTTDTDTYVDTAETTEAVIDQNNILETFERIDFEGKEFRIICSKYYNSNIGARQIPDEQENGEVLNDALFLRDQMLEEYFNIDIVYDYKEYESDGDLFTIISNNVLAGDDAADLVWTRFSGMTRLVGMNALVNLYDIPNIDLSREWWIQSVSTDVNLGGNVFFATGDITPRALTSAFVIGFNKELFNDYQLEEPYESVRDGSWTIDALNKITTDASSDLNGDDKMDENDFYGLVFEGWSQYAMFVGAGGAVFDLDGEGLPSFVADSELTMNVIEKMLSIIHSDDYYYNEVTYTANKIFRESRSLLISFACCDLSMLRDMTDDYGLLPMPKLSEDQSEYYCSANRSISTGIAVPVTLDIAEYERVGLLTEAMAALSHYTSMPAQYDAIMQQKHVRDEESIEMLKIALASTRYDLGSLYAWGGMADSIEEILENGGDFSSVIASGKSSATAEMEKSVEQILNGQ